MALFSLKPILLLVSFFGGLLSDACLSVMVSPWQGGKHFKIASAW